MTRVLMVLALLVAVVVVPSAASRLVRPASAAVGDSCADSYGTWFSDQPGAGVAGSWSVGLNQAAPYPAGPCDGDTTSNASIVMGFPDMTGYPASSWPMWDETCNGQEFGGYAGLPNSAATTTTGSIGTPTLSSCASGDVVTVRLGVEVALYSPGTYSGATTELVAQFRFGAPPLPLTAAQQRALGLGGGNGATNVQTCNQGHKPVTCSSGDFWHSFTDVAVPGRGAGLGVSRTYNSWSAAQGQSGPFGFGWSCSFCIALSFDGSGDATIVQGNGSNVTFTPNGSGGFTPAAGQFTSLVHNGDGTYTYTVRGRELYAFSSAGQLTATSDLDGNTISYTYTGSALTSITDQAGRTITIGYGTNGLVSTVTDPLSRVTSYTYDSSGNMLTSTDPASHVTQYSYDGEHLMLTMTDPNGGVTTNTFDIYGRTLTQTDPAGRETQYVYSGDNFSAAGGSTTITDPTGMVTVEDYTNGALTSLTKGYGTATPSTWTYTIDPTTLATTGVTDPDGYTSSQTYDSNGFLASVTDADGHTTSYTNDALGDVLTSTDPAMVTTTNTYTATGDLASTSTPLGTGTVTASFAHANSSHPGDVTSSTDANGHVTSYGYDSYGDLSSVTDPDGHITSATFDADGEKLTSVAADGNVSGCGCASAYTTSYAYYADGLLHTVTDPLGDVTTDGYDADGNLTTVTDPTAKTTTNTYDADDELTKVTQPDGSYVTYGYDGDGRRNSVANDTDPAATTTFDVLGDPLTVTDPTGAVTTNVYDLDGRLTQSTAPNGGVTHYTYNHAGQMLSTTSPTSGVTSTTYDADGRVHTVTDPDSNVTTYAYDALGRQTITTRADTTTTTNGYDNDGHVTSYTDGAGHITSYVFDAAGRETSSTDPDSRTTSFGYDASGNQTTITDASSRVTTNTFDHASQLTGVSYSDPGTHAVTYSYDAAGRRTGMTDATGTTTYSYDSYGRLSSVAAPAGTSGYSYDSLGRVATITYPDTRVVTRGYDAADRLSSVTDWNSHTTSFGYDGDGNETTTTYPNGVVDTTTVNAADQTTGITIKHGTTSLASFGYTPDAAGQVSASTDSLDSALSTSYAYTALNQLHTVASTTSHYVYDSSGNLTGLTNGTTQAYDPAGQLTTSTPTTGAATSYGFDGVGDRTSATTPAAADDPVNTQELSNTGFESALYSHSYAGGTLGETGYSAPTLSLDTTTFHSGAQSLKVVTTSSTAGQGFIQYPHSLSASVPAYTTVSGSFWIKAPSGTTLVAGGRAMKADGSASIGEGEGAVTFTATGAWQQITLNPFWVSQAAVIGIQAHLVTPQSGVTFWVDDSSLVALTASGSGDQQVLTNTGFETPLVFSGALGESPYYSSTISTDTSTAHSGAQSLKIVTNTTAHQQGFFQFPHSLSAVVPGGTVMQGSMWVKAPSGTVLVAGGRAQLPDGSAEYAEGQGAVTFTATGAWQLITLAPFTTPQSLLVGIQLHLVTPTSGVTFWVDDTSMLATTTQTYNQTSELTGFSSRNLAPTSYTYNGDGLRATSTTGGTTSNYGWDSLTGDVPVLLADATNDYVYGPGDIPIEQVNKTSGTTTYLHGDQIGSIRVATDGSGSVAATTSYDPYGNLINQTGTAGMTPFGFSGEYTDPTGLIYLRARYYDPATGQFLTVDPLVDTTKTPYAYVAGNPLNATDPSGLTDWLKDASDWSAGFGDAVTFGGTKAIRRLINYETTGCTTDLSSVDENSVFYRYGSYGGYVASLVPTGGGLAWAARGINAARDAARARLGFQTFHTVQDASDAARLRAGGEPWPSTPSRASLGQGVYSFGSRDAAERYAANLASRGASDLEVMSFRVATRDLASFASRDIDSLDDPGAFMSKYNQLWGGTPNHGFQYLTRGTQFGTEHFFDKSVFGYLGFDG